VLGIDWVYPNTHLLAYVLRRGEEINEEVSKGFFVTHGSSVFKVKGNVNEGTAVCADVSLLSLKGFYNKLLIASDVLAGSTLWERGGAFKWGHDHTPFLRDVLVNGKILSFPRDNFTMRTARTESDSFLSQPSPRSLLKYYR